MNTRKRDATSVAGYLNRLTGSMLSGRTVNCAVHTALSRPAEDFLDGLSALDHDLSTNSTGQLAAMRQWFHSPDSYRLSGSQCGDRQKPDWSCTNDRYRFARVDRS
jgi:hypothetical protein